MSDSSEDLGEFEEAEADSEDSALFQGPVVEQEVEVAGAWEGQDGQFMFNPLTADDQMHLAGLTMDQYLARADWAHNGKRPRDFGAWAIEGGVIVSLGRAGRLQLCREGLAEERLLGVGRWTLLRKDGRRVSTQTWAGLVDQPSQLCHDVQGQQPPDDLPAATTALTTTFTQTHLDIINLALFTLSMLCAVLHHAFVEPDVVFLHVGTNNLPMHRPLSRTVDILRRFDSEYYDGKSYDLNSLLVNLCSHEGVFFFDHGDQARREMFARMRKSCISRGPGEEDGGSNGEKEDARDVGQEREGGSVNQLCHIHSATTTGSSCISLPTPARTPTYSRLLHGLHVANLVTWDSLPKANYVGDLGATSGPRGAVGMTHQCVDTLCHPPSLVPAMG
ncbi:hypothetical protein Bbelb_084720 [Branchiostoma belcheri]|nr:hypothetical protein Bbelb_084720 [Branchiostoma belcheri]